MNKLLLNLKKIKQKKTYNRIIIVADYSVKHGEVVHIMEICHKVGFKKISIAAQVGN